jgi:hypothetical protein
MSGRRWAAIGFGMAVAAALTGCGGDETSDADLSAEPTRTPLVASSNQLADYSDEEAAAYREAVSALEHNIKVGLDVYREGLATPAARRALESVYTGDELEDEWEHLQEMDAAGGYLDGSATLVWAKPVRVLVSDSAGTVDVRACVDRRDVEAYQHGSGELASPESKRAVFEVTVDLGSDGEWRVADGEETGTC